jgi:hypothetical protein
LEEDVRKRFELLNSKTCTEPHKRLKKNAIINMCVAKDGSAKIGTCIVTKLPPQLKNTICSNRTDFQKSWEEGEGIVIVKARMGKDLYEEALAAGYLGKLLLRRQLTNRITQPTSL